MNTPLRTVEMAYTGQTNGCTVVFSIYLYAETWSHIPLLSWLVSFFPISSWLLLGPDKTIFPLTEAGVINYKKRYLIVTRKNYFWAPISAQHSIAPLLRRRKLTVPPKRSSTEQSPFLLLTVETTLLSLSFHICKMRKQSFYASGHCFVCCLLVMRVWAGGRIQVCFCSNSQKKWPYTSGQKILSCSLEDHVNNVINLHEIKHKINMCHI